MDKLHRIAKAHYNGQPEEYKIAARKVFDEMDKDGDGSVDIKEFMKFIKENETENGTHFCEEKLFSLLDKDKNGSLDFWEAVTFVFLGVTKRPWCDSCSTFLTDTHLTCVECFSDTFSYDLCVDCYTSFNWNHNHDGPPIFLDNYDLLRQQAERIKQLGDQAAPRETYAAKQGSSTSKKVLKTLEVTGNVVNVVNSCATM